MGECPILRVAWLNRFGFIHRNYCHFQCTTLPIFTNSRSLQFALTGVAVFLFYARYYHKLYFELKADFLAREFYSRAYLYRKSFTLYQYLGMFVDCIR